MTGKLKELSRKFKNGQIDKEHYIRLMHNAHKTLSEYCGFIRDKNIKSIKISEDGLVFTTKNDIKMICDPEDERALPLEIMNFGDYETDEINMLRNFLKKDSVVIDIGANIGWHSLNLSGDVPDGRIIAFEPMPRTIGYLKKNIALNRVTNIKVMDIGLSDKSGTAEFYYDPKLTVAASMRELHENRKKKKIICRVRRLDDFILRMAPRIDLIKCDVEGAELLVMRGAIETLKKTRPVLFVEMLRKWSAKFGYYPDEIIDLLGSIGYLCYYAKDNGLVEIGRILKNTKPTNFYFLDVKKHAKFIKELT
jgi:FkbM family methyltransferase